MANYRCSSSPSPLISLLLLLGAASSGLAQDGYFGRWFDRSDQAKASQPHWMTPLVTVTPRLEQEFRTDFVYQPFPDGNPSVNFGNGKGLELIPASRTEIIFNVPPYIEHNRNRIHDGFGDVSFLGKYRVIAKPEERGNYIITFFLAASVPTGSYSNGARAAVITPTIAAGKGWGKFDIQSTLSGALPVSHVNMIGHAIAFNNAFQYHILPKLWPEVELNTTWWRGGMLDGKHANYVTPGLILGRFHLIGRVSIAAGAGVQIATTAYHPYTHAYVFTVRFPF